jgi:phosphatidate phosphatase APP1
MSAKTITVFPSYGYRDGDEWKIPLRVWIRKPGHGGKLANLLLQLAAEARGTSLQDEEQARFEECIGPFIADDDWNERVTVRFDGTNDEFQFKERTDANGVVEEEFVVSGEWAKRGEWLTVTATAWGDGREHKGEGRVRLIEPIGSSVVSDIDDTIKVTDILSGNRVVLRNTFLRKYVRAEAMREMYEMRFNARAFHYVSGSPWQLYPLLHQFMQEEGFPEGSFHMRRFGKHWTTLIRDLLNFLKNKEGIAEQKKGQIGTLMQRFPGRRFTLIGDSGELDPEVFAELRSEYGDQVEKIIIRDVAGAKLRRRLQGMEVLEVTEVVS